MTEGGTLNFGDSDSYAAGFGAVRLKLTITGAGDFKARLTRLQLQHLEIYRCHESLPRIGYISVPPEQIVLLFPLGKTSPILNGFAFRNGDISLHERGGSLHQRSLADCKWGLISLSAAHLASCAETLTGRPNLAPQASTIMHPSRDEGTRFRRLYKEACDLAETGKKLIQRSEIARALEHHMLHAIIHCLAADGADDNSKTRHHHAALMARFEEVVSRRIDQKLAVPKLCAEICVAERTLRMCCAEFLGVSPMRYILLQRLNRARSALWRADPSRASVAEVARNHQFLELGRFAVMYRATFGESPSTTLHRGP